MAFARFMSSAAGRGIRIVAGLALIAWGYASGLWLVVAIGVLPLAAGTLDLCLFAPLFGGPLRGRDVPRA